jgi:hypothetical protein
VVANSLDIMPGITYDVGGCAPKTQGAEDTGGTMRVIVKHPEQAPEEADLDMRAIEKLLGSVESCLSGPGVKAYCDGDGLGKELQLNLIRPSDGSPIVGPVVVFGHDGPNERGLTDREVALWMATLAVIGVDGPDGDGSWRPGAIASLAPLVHEEDREAYERLARLVQAVDKDTSGWSNR